MVSLPRTNYAGAAALLLLLLLLLQLPASHSQSWANNVPRQVVI